MSINDNRCGRTRSPAHRSGVRLQPVFPEACVCCHHVGTGISGQGALLLVLQPGCSTQQRQLSIQGINNAGGPYQWNSRAALGQGPPGTSGRSVSSRKLPSLAGLLGCSSVTLGCLMK